jgi:hypothetical protein
MENNNWGAPQQQPAQWPAAAGFQPALGPYAAYGAYPPMAPRAYPMLMAAPAQQAMLGAAPAQQLAPPPPPLPRAAPKDISMWLDEVKPGYAEKYASIFEDLGVDDEEDVQNLRDDLARDLRAALENAGAKRGHLNNIESAVIAKRANAAPRHLALLPPPPPLAAPPRALPALLPPPPAGALPALLPPPAAAGPRPSALLTAWLDEVQCQGPVRERVLAIANDVPELFATSVEDLERECSASTLKPLSWSRFRKAFVKEKAARAAAANAAPATPANNAAPVTPVAAAPSPAAPATPVAAPAPAPADEEELPDAPPPEADDDDDAAPPPPPPASDDEDEVAPRRSPRRSRSPRPRQPAAPAPRRSRSPRARQSPAAPAPRRSRSPRARQPTAQPAAPAAPAAPAWQGDFRELLAAIRGKSLMELRGPLTRYGFKCGPTYPGKWYYDVSVPITYPCYYDLVGKNYSQHQDFVRSTVQLTKYLEGALALAGSSGTIRLESARRAELETLSSESKQRSLAKLMVRRFQRELAVSESVCVHAIDATPRAGKLRFRIQEKVAAALSASPRLTPSPDKAVEAAKEQGWNAADLVEVYLWGQDDSSDDDDDVDPDGPRILGLLHRGDLCTLKADDKVIVKVVSVGRRKVDVTFVNWHEGMTKSVKPSELVPMNLDEGRQPRRHVGRLAVGARLVRVSCMDGFHDGVVRSVEQFGYEVRFADGDEGFVSLKQAHEAAARALEKKRSAEESSSSKPAAKKRK